MGSGDMKEAEQNILNSTELILYSEHGDLSA